MTLLQRAGDRVSDGFSVLAHSFFDGSNHEVFMMAEALQRINGGDAPHIAPALRVLRTSCLEMQFSEVPQSLRLMVIRLCADSKRSPRLVDVQLIVRQLDYYGGWNY